MWIYFIIVIIIFKKSFRLKLKKKKKKRKRKKGKLLKSGKQKKEIPLNFQFVFNLLEIMFETRECENMNALVGMRYSVCVHRQF